MHTKTLQLRNPDLLRNLVGPDADHLMTARNLAQRANIHYSYVSLLRSGRRTTVSVDVARRMAQTLGVRLGVLFARPESNSTRIVNKLGVSK